VGRTGWAGSVWVQFGVDGESVEGWLGIGLGSVGRWIDVGEVGEVDEVGEVSEVGEAGWVVGMAGR
jgi:hypothetical protein